MRIKVKEGVRKPIDERNGFQSGGGNHFDPWRKSKFLKQLFAIFPRQTKRTHIGNAEAGDDGRKRVGVALGNFAVEQRTLRPIHQLCQRDLVMEIRGNLVGDGLFGDRHGGTLHFFVAFIYREFLMRLDQLSLVIVNLLPETHGHFVGIHFLEIPRQLTQFARHIEPVASPAAG